ncbi:MAG: DUF4118 domain-containing protein, partial [Christensenellales bacterium]
MKVNKNIVVDILKMLLVIALATVLAYGFEAFNFSSENILLVYVVADIIVILETRKLQYGIISGVICSVVYDFIFVSPKYSFLMNDKSYLISIGIYIAVCIVISIMSYRLQAQIKKAERSELLVKSTYENSKNLLKMKSPEDIANYEVKKLNELLNRKVCIGLKKRKNFLLFGDKFISLEDNLDVFNYAISYNLICGYKEQKYSEFGYKVYPLKTSKTNFGVIVVDCALGDLKKNEKEYIRTNITHIVMALDREKIQDQKEDVKEKIEIEELKNALVLNASNDIREPINDIGNKCQLLISNYDALSDESVINILYEINLQNKKLNEYVNYLFNISSLGSGEEVKNLKKVTIINIVEGALSQFDGDFNGHIVNYKCEDCKVTVDPELMQDVFAEIIRNSLRHTKVGCELNIACHLEDNDVVIEFEDNGEGLDEKQLESIFDTK